MLKFTRTWVAAQMLDLWEEMVGIRPTLQARSIGQTPPATRNDHADLKYAKTWVPFSDLRAARLIQLQMENRLTYAGTDQGGTWYFWNGVYHQEVKSGIVGDWVTEAFADQVVEAMNHIEDRYESLVADATTRGDTNEVRRLEKELKDAWRQHRNYQDKLHSDSGLNSLKSRLKKQCAKEPDYFDEDRRWMVCLNGVIDLDEFRKTKQVRLLPHSPFRPVTRTIMCDFNPKASAPNWERFLETSQPSEELREFLQRLVGAAFLAESKVKAIANLQGPKDCGKSVFVTTLDRLAGDYGIQPSPTALMKVQGQNWEQETLRGKRFVGVSEPSSTDRLDDTFCKQVTGGDVVHTRAHYQASVGWVAQCVMFVASNQPVKFNTRDQAFLDRICMIKFPHQFFDTSEAAEGEIHIKDPDLERKLNDEFEGIFNWVVWGMWKYLVQGLEKPDTVKRAGEDIQVDASQALTWVREKVDEGLLEIVDSVADKPLSHYAVLGKLYSAYQNDMFMDGEKPFGKHAFSSHLQSKYGDSVKVNSGVRIPRLVGVGKWSHFDSNKPSADSSF